MKRIALFALIALALSPAPVLAMASKPVPRANVPVEAVPLAEYTILHDQTYVPAQVARDAARRAGNTSAEADYNALTAAVAQAQVDQASGDRARFDTDVATAKAAAARVLAKVG